jgi:hydroxypyruvate reductase
MVATPQMALTAAAAAARANGYTPMILGDAIEGEAREVGQVMAAIAAQVARHQQPLAAPAILLSGGETTVTVRGSGCGGRNVEFLLALGLALDQRAGDCRDRIAAIACDTDGIDGAATVAGAYLPADTARRAKDAGVDLSSALAGNDGHGFFAALQTAVITGPTLTNVNDFRAILIDRQAN